MADKNIGSLDAATSFDDSSKLIAEQQGEAVQVPGALLRQYAENAGSTAGAQAGAEAGKTAGYEAAKTITKGDPGKDGEDGQDGQDGVSPTVEVTAITGGHRISITDANGTKTFDVMDGEDGQDGNGVPTVSAADNGKVLGVVNGQIALVTPSYPVITQNGTVLRIE